MHAKKLLHKLYDKAIHQKRIGLLIEIVEGVLKTKSLSLTRLGRGLDLPIQERSSISKVNRFLGNVYFQKETEEFYSYLTGYIINGQKRPTILVDWTKLPELDYYALRASLSMPGRALTLYEEVHPKKKEGTQKVHKLFLKRLKEMLPLDCHPIIVTDAGFKNPWFKEVLKCGWDFIGRVRGLLTYQNEAGEFVQCSDLYKQATREAQSLGAKILAKSNPLEVCFYIIRDKLKRRKNRTRNGKASKHKDSIAHGRSHREPWLLVSSLKGRWAAKQVVKFYRQRMGIEEAFRDLKSSQYGLGFENNHTLKYKRFAVWLLVAALASFIAWVVGYIAETQGLHRQFQANSTRTRRVLSFFYLGCEVIRKKIKITINWQQLIFTEVSFTRAATCSQ